MNLIGHIKFAHVKGNTNTKTEYMRVCHKFRDNAGDWKSIPTFPPTMQEFEFYFPFTKLENNIKVRYSGYADLPVSKEKGAPSERYLIVADGIGEPIMAIPSGHNGIIWDGTKDGNGAMVLDEARLEKWSKGRGGLKKRTTVYMVPKGYAPHEVVTWTTSSEAATNYLLEAYSSLEQLTKHDLAFLPLTLRSVGKQFVNTKGDQVKFHFGAIGYSGSLVQLRADLEEVDAIKGLFDTGAIEKRFEEKDFFFTPDEGAEIFDDDEPHDVPAHDSLTGEVLENVGDPSIILEGLVSQEQKQLILQLAEKHGRLQMLSTVQNAAQALVVMNKLQLLEKSA